MDCTGAVYAKKDLGKDWSLRAFSANVKGMQSFLFLADTKVFGIALNAWKVIGLTGSIIFGLRFLIQWLASERARKSVIPFGFWECSALGSLLTLAYFAIYRHDSVGVLQTARSEEHTSELQSPVHLVCRLLLEKKK